MHPAYEADTVAAERGRELLAQALGQDRPLAPVVRRALTELLDTLDSAADAADEPAGAMSATYRAGVLDSLLARRDDVLAALATIDTRRPGRGR